MTPTRLQQARTTGPTDTSAQTAPVRRLGDLLLQAHLLSEQQLQAALAAQQIRRKRLGEILREDGVLDDVTVAAVVSVQLDTPIVDLRERPSEDAALRMIPEPDARRLSVVPLASVGERLV